MSAWKLRVDGYLCLFMFVIFVSGREFSPEQQEAGWLWVCGCQEHPQNPFRKEARLQALLKGGLPMTSFTLAHCLFDPVAVPVVSLFLFLLSPTGPCLCVWGCLCALTVCLCFCLLGKLHTCHGSPPELCNLEALTPPTHTQPLPALPLFQTTLAPTDRALCVTLTCFLSTGAPNSTSGPP